MYYNLTGALTNRIIQELREFWALHPQFPDLPDNIQGKFAFKQRPQHAIIVKPSGSSHTRLAADNFIFHLVSYIFQYKLKDWPGLSVEWVREDSSAIQRNEGRFPSPPGIYFIDIVQVPGYDSVTGQVVNGQFMVDPLLDVRDEKVTMVTSTLGQLMNTPLVSGTLRLYHMPFGGLLYEDVNYTIDYASGEITFLQPISSGTWVSADYRHPGATTGPHEFVFNYANHQAIPGVVLAFGRRAFVGDKLAVVVQETRSPSALAFGGRWETSMDLDIWARDVDEQREMSDMTAIYLEGILRSYLSNEGILLRSVQIGGESETVYDDNADDYFFNGSISLSLETEWEIHVPLARYIRSASPLNIEQARLLTQLRDDELADFETNLRLVEAVGLDSYKDPFFRNRSTTFELIR